ncbi:MAG: amino acid-binding protein [Lachnospiraceae bacterium]|nr:amino acid-binding protein [Lachnospiraceae bacterium]MBR1523379.1 amino acid-binding protein [Lachnospiraceae bacterium]
MLVKQLSVFLENRPGTLDEALKVLKEADINMKALSLADTSEFGVMRIIADKPDEAKQAMKNAGYTSIVNEVISVELKSEVGYLAGIVKKISDAGVNIEYMYAAPSKDSEAKMLIKTDDAARAQSALGE